jgi:hypothetical protein
MSSSKLGFSRLWMSGTNKDVNIKMVPKWHFVVEIDRIGEEER